MKPTLSVLALPAFLAVGLPSTQAVRAVFEKNRQSIEVLGVCKLADGVLTCWTPDGRPSDDLTQQVNRSLSQTQNDAGFYLVPGKKTRMAIVRSVQRSPVGTSVYLRGINGNSSWLSQRSISSRWVVDVDGSESQRTELYSFAAGSDQSTASFEGSVTETVDQANGVSPRPGTTFRCGGAEIEILGFSRITNDPKLMNSEASWKLLVDVKKASDVGLSMVAVGKDGNVIMNTDKEGKPAPFRSFEYNPVPPRGGTAPSTLGQGGGFARMTMPYLSLTPARTGKMEVRCAIDPSVIASLRVSANKTSPFELANLPLDPISTHTSGQINQG